jgi:BirA family biotin operon repressor/biotin-[acetyl-CoA-carboxylase] ligase
MSFKLGPRAQSAGFELRYFDATGSTNAEAISAARAGDVGPTWFVASEQTAGRGRRQRPWSAPRGNLASSILEVIKIEPQVAATLGFAAGVAMEAALRQVSVEAMLRAPGSANTDYRLKWPNDVLVGGKKLCGILLEAEPAPDGRLAVVVGIGANVVAFPEDTPYPATSLHALGVSISAEELFSVLSDTWAEMRGIWDDGRGFSNIRQLWLQHAAGLGGPVSIKTGAASVEGIFDTVDDAGCLIVRTADGKRVPISAGDVYFNVTASAGAT